LPLFGQLGGEEGIARIVDAFYARVVADDLLAPWFDGVDLVSLKAHQRGFLTVALGGPEAYDGRSMRNAHAGLGIGDAEYSRALAHLADALDACGVSAEAIATVNRRIGLMRAAIVEVR
jgi:hemoglobin